MPRRKAAPGNFMTQRQAPRAAEAARAWTRFVERNAAALEAAGLPALATKSIRHWDDLLTHGSFDYHPDGAGFHLSQLTESQYAAYVDLVDSYFAAGYEYYTPMALRIEDRQRLAARHDTRR